MSENVVPIQPAAPQRVVAYISFPPDAFNELVNSIGNLPYRNAAPLMDLLQKHGRAIFEDQLAKIVPDVPDTPAAGTPLENQNEGGA